MSNRDFDPRIVALDDEQGGEIVSVLASDSTRRVYSVIEGRPSTPKTIADGLEMSVQNVHYHLDKIQDAGLVEPTAIEYSEKGREMHVYGPVHDEVIVCSDRETKDRLDRLLRRLVDGSMAAVLLAAMSHVVLTRILGVGPGRSSAGSTADSGSTTAETVSAATWGEFPAVWILAAVLIATLLYATWQYRREKPAKRYPT